jgi:methionine-rich copper-binding protein CopC
VRRPRVHRRAATVAALLFLSVWFAPSVASAHSVLISTTPPAAAVASMPDAVHLDFNERPRGRFSVVHVFGPDGGRRDAGTLSVLNDTVTQPIAGSRPAGVYTVDWRVVSADGHPVSGQWRFTATAAAAPLAEPSVAAAPAAASKDDDGGAHLGHAVLAVVIVLLLGASYVGERLWKRRTRS